MRRCRAKTPDNPAVVCIELGDNIGTEIFESADLGKVARIDKEQP